MKEAVQIDRVLDLRGWSCPWCIVKARSWLSRMEPGQILELFGTDPEALKNLPSILKNGNDRIIDIKKYPDHHQLLIRRGSRGSSPHGGRKHQTSREENLSWEK